MSPTANTARATSAYLTFEIGDEEYGVAILAVREIVRGQPATPLPGARPHVAGVIDLRGSIVPVMSMRSRFGLPPASDPRNVIVVIDGRDGAVGLAVDRVCEVAHLAADELEAPPHDALGEGSGVTGLGRAGQRIRIILDIHRILAA